MECNCPAPTALTVIPAQVCAINLNQIQRIAFQRSGVASIFDDLAMAPTIDIKLLADWQVFTAAADDTKIVVTPLISADPTIVAGEAITNGGGDNSTLNGVEEVEGTNPSTFTATFKSLSLGIEKPLKELMCDPNLNVYFFLQGGRIAAKKLIPTTQQSGFDITSLFIGDRGNEGFGTKDTNAISFQLSAGWSEDLVIFDADELDFNPLTDL